MSNPMLIFLAAIALLLVAGIILVTTQAGRDKLFGCSSNAGSPAGRIRILDGSLAGMEIPVSAKLVLGRDPDLAQIVFPDEETAVSRRHCEIGYDNAISWYEVRDLGSRNGTFVIGSEDRPRRLHPNVVELVAPGQSILVGTARNRLFLEPSG